MANTKQNKLTFDEAPTDNSTNPVTSKGIKKYVDDTVTSGTVDLTNYATKTYVTAAISDKANRSGFLTAHQDISGKQDKLTFDNDPTDSSDNPVKSKGIKKYVDDKITAVNTNKADKSDIPTKVSQLTNDKNYLTTHQDISGKQDKLTFDNDPTENSDNPVKSKGIKLYVDNKVAVVSTNQATNYYTKAQVNTELDKKLNKDDFVELSKTELQSIWDSIIV